MDESAVTVFQAAAARDAAGVDLRPAAIVVRNGLIEAVGSPEEIRRQFGRDAHTIQMPRALLLPALVNAHAHLDLTLLGPQPAAPTFVGWLRAAAARRPTDPESVRRAVHEGLRLLREAGVGFVGDVAGGVAAARAFLDAPVELQLPGVTFLECFGIGRRQLDGFARLMQDVAQLPQPGALALTQRGLNLGLQPHAPYSAGLALYNAAGRFAQEREYRLCTHLAESPEELAFIRHADGPFADLLREWRKWDDTIGPGHAHPIEWLEPELRRGGWLAVHCNCVEDEQIQILAYCRASVAYCPIASDYFHLPPYGPHRYRDMLEAGVNVCLGTDSILCQPAHETQPLGILPQMRCLWRRDRTDPPLLLRMATTHGLVALGLSDTLATLAPGVPANLIAVEFDPGDPTDALTQVLRSDQPALPICLTGLPRPQEHHADAVK